MVAARNRNRFATLSATFSHGGKFKSVCATISFSGNVKRFEDVSRKCKLRTDRVHGRPAAAGQRETRQELRRRESWQIGLDCRRKSTDKKWSSKSSLCNRPRPSSSYRTSLLPCCCRYRCQRCPPRASTSGCSLFRMRLLDCQLNRHAWKRPRGS